MRTFAPGKLVLTGAYAVLQGAPAISVAVSRGALADSSRAALDPTPEVRAALGAEQEAPHCDASSMFVGSRKLGLGASAAILVASLAAVDAAGGDLDPTQPDYRAKLFARARAAHARAQDGGSGVDVATSVYGGMIHYVVSELPRRVSLPPGLVLTVFACGTSARTSELRGEVDRLAGTDAPAHRASMDELSAIARDGARAASAGDGAAFVDALRRTARALARLGDAARVAIVPPGFSDLEGIAAREEASFSVSGAGGGDVAVFMGRAAPSATFVARAHALGLFSLGLSLDHKGVRTAPPSASALAEAHDGAS
jgi:phosphomevalonate kinase